MDIDKEAFWSKVDIKDTAKECWNWLGAKKLLQSKPLNAWY